MSALPVTGPPIQRLNFDVLSCIFKINADMFSEGPSALETTLATSRVCRDWRNFMLSTSSIWARLIDFRQQHLIRDKGIRELVRRSGESLLWIKIPYLTTSELRQEEFILNTVGENWQRIQKLDLTIGYGFRQWQQLYLPAPQLESFGISFVHSSTKYNNVLLSLFGGSAPMLRELRLSGRNITARPSWLHQLRSLDLGGRLTVSETLSILMFTENLVNLRLVGMVPGRSASILPLVSLPKLAHLDLKFAFIYPSPVSVLDHIHIPPVCSLTISVDWSLVCQEEINTIYDFEPIIRSISTSARPHLRHHTPRQLNLTITDIDFILETRTCSDKPKFRLRIENELETFPEHKLSVLLTEFSLPNFSTVTSLRLTTSRTINHLIPGFTTFMACLPAVNTIITDEVSLRHFCACSSLQMEFPVLRVLEITNIAFRALGRSDFDSADLISKFVMAHVARGHALSTIDFTGDTLNFLPDMEFFGKARGLRVRWRQRGVAEIREYICGTGPPQKVESV